MCRSGKCFQSLLTLVIVLASVSICEAGVFGRWRISDITMRKFSAVRCGTGCSGPGSAGDIRDCVHGQQTCERGGWRKNTSRAEPTFVKVVPCDGGWSTMPRSSWDFGKLPPYSN